MKKYSINEFYSLYYQNKKPLQDINNNNVYNSYTPVTPHNSPSTSPVTAPTISNPVEVTPTTSATSNPVEVKPSPVSSGSNSPVSSDSNSPVSSGSITPRNRSPIRQIDNPWGGDEYDHYFVEPENVEKHKEYLKNLK